MKFYEENDLFKTRHDDIDGQSNWKWIKEDEGAWEGPRSDWITSHKRHIQKYVKNFEFVVCAGGNQGMYPALLNSMFKVVYTFEPDPLNFHCLVNNCQSDSIVKINGALAEKNKMIHVKRHDPKNTGCNTIEDSGFIPAFALDNFDFPALDLIYLDIEGYEYNALQGAKETINKWKPAIFAERADKPEIIEFLSSFGYEMREKSVSDQIFTINN